MLPSSPSASESESSSSSPIADSGERPVSRGPVPPPKAFKAYGQDYRYAENWENPLPELIVSSSYTHPTQTGASSAATPATPAAVDSVDGAYDSNPNAVHNDIPSSHRPETAGSKEADMQESVWVEPQEKPWYKKLNKHRYLVCGLTFLGILAVLLAILGAMGKLSSGSDSDTTNSSAAGSSTPTAGGPTSASSSTGILPQPTGDVKISCDDKSTFITGIQYVFADGANPDFTNGTGSAEDCCVACLDSDISCAGWTFDAANKFTPCTRVLLTDGDSNQNDKDDRCPQGKAAQTTLQRSGKGVAGVGPCGGKVIFK